MVTLPQKRRLRVVKRYRLPINDDGKLVSTSPYDRSTLRYGNEAKPNDEQATRVAYFKSEMFALWPPKLPGLSRGVVFYFGML